MASNTQSSPEMNNFKKNSPLIKKVKDLKFQDDKNKEIIKTQEDLISMFKEQIEELKEENDKIHQEWEMEVDECRAIYFRSMEENKKLKEENDKLKEEYRKMKVNLKIGIALQEENKRLKNHVSTLKYEKKKQREELNLHNEIITLHEIDERVSR